MSFLRIIAVTGAAASLFACASIAGTDDDRVVGVIEPLDGAAVLSTTPSATPDDAAVDPMSLPILEAPDTVRAGVPFEVVVRTYGNDGCWRAAGGDVSVSGSTVRITPYDSHGRAPGMMCAGVIVRLPRSFEVVFPRPGDGVIRVTGRRVLGPERYGSAAVEKRIVVR